MPPAAAAVRLVGPLGLDRTASSTPRKAKTRRRTASWWRSRSRVRRIRPAPDRSGGRDCATAGCRAPAGGRCTHASESRWRADCGSGGSARARATGRARAAFAPCPALLEVVARDRTFDRIAKQNDHLEPGVVASELTGDLREEEVGRSRFAPNPRATVPVDGTTIASVDLLRGPVGGIVGSIEEMHLLGRRHRDLGVPGEELRERGRPGSLRADDS